jgi:hypothetical protein
MPASSQALAPADAARVRGATPATVSTSRSSRDSAAASARLAPTTRTANSRATPVRISSTCTGVGPDSGHWTDRLRYEPVSLACGQSSGMNPTSSAWSAVSGSSATYTSPASGVSRPSAAASDGLTSAPHGSPRPRSLATEATDTTHPSGSVTRSWA